MTSSSSTCSDDLKRVQTLRQSFQKKMVAEESNVPLKPVRTKPQKLSSKGVSRNLSVKSSSSEYYPDSPVEVPFLWESQPGTPKIRHRQSLIPPLSPPPSYTLTPDRNHVKKQPKPKTLLQNILPRLSFAKSHTKTVSPPVAYTLPRTSYSVPSSPCNPSSRAQCRPSSSTSSSESRADSDDYESPSPIFCFNIGRRSNVRSSEISTIIRSRIFHGDDVL